MSFNIQSRAVTGIVTATGATIGMAVGHQPPIWIAISCIGGFVVGWFMPRRWLNVRR